VGQPVRPFVLGAAVRRHIRRRAYREHTERRIDSAEIVSSSSWLLIAVLLVPTLLFLIVAWQDRRLVFDDAERDILRTVDIFEQHARNVFQTHALVAAQIDERIRGMGWDEIAKSEELHQYLESISRRYPQAESLWLLDSAGIVRNSSLVLPQKPINGADEDFFIELRKGDAGDFISRPIVGKVRGLVHFNLARRRTSGTKNFDGVIVVTVHPTYFIQFWRSVVAQPNQSAMGLVRADGTVLAREPFPHYEAPKLGPETRFMQEVGRAPAGGSYRAVSALDRIERFFAYRKIDGFPVYVTYGVAVRDAAAVWHQHLITYGSFFAIATLGLAVIAVAAMRHARRAADALDHWRATTRQLAAEAKRRAATEDQLHQAQKMEAPGQMTGGLAHDLNNVLAIISGNLELLRPRITDVRSIQLAERALTAAERAEKSITSLLSFARRQPLRSERFDLNKALQDMEGLMHQALGEKISLETMLSPDLRQVETEPDQSGRFEYHRQCARRHAGRRRSPNQDRQSGVERRPGRSSGLVRRPELCRHRKRNRPPSAVPGFRTLLHNQRARQGNRARAQHGLWVRKTIPRIGLHPQYCRAGYDDYTISPLRIRRSVSGGRRAGPAEPPLLRVAGGGRWRGRQRLRRAFPYRNGHEHQR